jgi:hypothetical protein
VLARSAAAMAASRPANQAMLVVAPQRLDGATGLAVNPLAIF